MFYICNLQDLLFVRVLQALGSCVGLFLARATIRDVPEMNEVAKAFPSMMIVMDVAPVIATSLGAVLWALFYWKSILIALAWLGVVALLRVLLQFLNTT